MNGNAEGLEVIGASAGSGKTFTLTRTVCSAVDLKGTAPIAPESLLGVTFTNKAANELGSRIRQTLLQSGAIDQAQNLPMAYLGTVHGVCLRLIEEFAIDAGLAPDVEVLSDATLQLRAVVERTLDAPRQARMAELVRHLQVDMGMGRSNWLFRVYAIMDLVRGNRLDPSELPGMAERSIAELRELLPRPIKSADALDAQLQRQLDRAIDDLGAAIDGGDSTKGSAELLSVLQGMKRKFGRDDLSWKDWAQLSQAAPAKRSAACAAGLNKAASEYESHPRFHAELEEFTRGVYDIARRALNEYDGWKRSRGFVDYPDMIERALLLVENEEIRAELRSRLKLVVVDEFQDTSPIQLSLFVKLHQITGRSVWVGDRKQCIFEFAGADPRLMKQVLTWAGARGGSTRQLETNYRSRPALVDFCSRVFSRGLSQHGYSRQEIVVGAHREDLKQQSDLPSLGHWRLEARNQSLEADALAAGVRKLLAEPHATPVIDSRSGEVRPLVGGDVAILVRSNAEAQRVAEALSALGIRAAIARSGLVSTPEGVLLQAGLSLLLDERDRLARAKLEALHGFDGVGPDAWLCSVITEARGECELPKPAWWGRFSELRERLHSLSPTEAVLEVLDALDLTTLAARWPAPQQRLANLDALCALAHEYEEWRASESRACTVAGLLGYFGVAAAEAWDGEEMSANDDQAFTEDDGAVVLMTYHRSKGLEWPVVILSSLHSGPGNDCFGVHLESDRAEFDADAPLDGRWVRFWPKPFGGRTKGVGLFERAAATERMTRVEAEEREERARLLYVGMTRARDHLIFAVRKSTTWLDELDNDGAPLIEFSDGAVLVHGDEMFRYPARSWKFEPAEEGSVTIAQEEPRVFTRVNAGQQDAPRFLVSPSTAGQAWPAVPALELPNYKRLGEPLRTRATKATDWAEFGSAVHAFFACDLPGLSDEERLVRAERLLAAVGDQVPIGAREVLIASDRLRQFVEQNWPGAWWHREVPVTSIVDAADGPRKVQGTIDLLLETTDALIVIDHKSGPNPTEAHLLKAAAGYSSQLSAYVEALRCASAKPVREVWVHFAVAGAVVGGGVEM